MRSLGIVEPQEAVERALELSEPSDMLAPERHPPVLMQDGPLESLDEAVGPRMAGLGARVPDVSCGAGGPKGSLERLPVIGQHSAQAPARRRMAGYDHLDEECCHHGGRDLPGHDARPPRRRGGIAGGQRPDLADPLQLADVERVQRAEVARLVRGHVLAHPPRRGPLGEQPELHGALLLEHREALATGAQAVAVPHALDGRGRPLEPLAGQAGPDPPGAAGRLGHGFRDDPPLGDHRDLRRASGPSQPALWMHAPSAIPLDALPPAVERGPRDPVPPTARPDIPPLLRLGQHQGRELPAAGEEKGPILAQRPAATPEKVPSDVSM
jgi:hypothetical protein